MTDEHIRTAYLADGASIVYLSPGSKAQKRSYHTDPDSCQSMPEDPELTDMERIRKDEAEEVRDLDICTWCDDGIEQTEHDHSLNNILRNADPEDGWDGVREDIREVKADD
jgi:hypothetical protein